MAAFMSTRAYDDNLVPIVMQVLANEASGWNFVFRVGVADASLLTKKTTYDITQWIGKVLLTVVSHEDGDFGPWEIVWSNDYDEDSPEFYVLAHLANEWVMPTKHDGFVIVGDRPVRTPREVSAATIAEHFTTTCPARVPYPSDLPPIIKLGISAVDDVIMSRYWWYVIDGQAGYMTAPMWFGRMEFTIRETSSDFGWDKYPPKDNADGDLDFGDLA